MFYAFKRSDRDVRKFCKEHDIEISDHATGVPYLFIDVDDAREELRAVKLICERNLGTTLYVVQHSDLGHGAMAKKQRLELEAMGTRVVVPEKVLEKRGPKPKHGLNDEQIARYRHKYEAGVVSQQHIIDTILRETGNKVTRHQLRTMFKK